MTLKEEFEKIEEEILWFRENARDLYLKNKSVKQGEYEDKLEGVPITFDTYQSATYWSGKFPPNIPDYIYTSMGLAGEVGEFVGKLSKIFRDKEGIISDSDLENLSAELGDCMYYLAATAKCLGLKLSDIAKYNQTKLVGRIKRGTISGDGDNR